MDLQRIKADEPAELVVETLQRDGAVIVDARVRIQAAAPPPPMPSLEA